jgi:hypothetical protein
VAAVTGAPLIEAVLPTVTNGLAARLGGLATGTNM